MGAIRVGGPTWLKALIGRARETFATAEMEQMSSTSDEVCELWNGRTIVRVMGTPRIFELLFFEKEYDGEEADKTTGTGNRTFGLHTIEDAEEHGQLISSNAPKVDPKMVNTGLDVLKAKTETCAGLDDGKSTG